MTVSTETRRTAVFIGDDVATTFPFAFVLPEASDLRVVVTDANLTESELAFGIDFNVSLNSNQDLNPGGTVFLSVPLAVGLRMAMSSKVPNTQLVKLTNAGGFYPTTLNGALDRVTIQVQQIREQLSRSVAAPFTGVPLTGPINVDNVVFGMGEDGLTPELRVLTDLSEASIASLFIAAFLQSTTKGGARGVLDAAKSGANTDITGMGDVEVPTQDLADSSLLIANTAFVEAAIAAIVTESEGVTTGMVAYFPGNTPPDGYLKANGALVSRTEYADLWTYAQASGNIAASDGVWAVGQFSPGDGSTTFRLPDLRGEFLRGWDDGRGVDSGRAVGSFQNHQFETHHHGRGSTAGGPGGYGGTSFSLPGLNPLSGNHGSETRPRNIAFLACIKY